MSLSTLLEAAKYLDYLDSSNQQQLPNNLPPHQQQEQQQKQHYSWQQQLQQQTKSSKQGQKSSASSASRRRGSKKANILMPPMSLPTNYGAIHLQGVTIPMVSGNNNNQTASSLSSSLTTGSPLSSASGFPSTALLCSNTSSASSSLSSSTSSSCGDIVMRDNDFNCPSAPSGSARAHNSNLTHQATNNDLSLCLEASNNDINDHHQVASNPQLMPMSTKQSSQAITSGHLIRTQNGALLSSNGAKIESMQFSLTNIQRQQQQHNQMSGSVGTGLGGLMGQYNGDLAGSPNAHPPLMARVPVILNSLSPTAQSSMTSYQNCSSSPTSVSSSYSRHRELHKTLEKNRRAHLRHCFELLKAELPASEYVDKKTSHINIIKSAIKYVLVLRQQESELETELQHLARIKYQLTENMSSLRGRQHQQESRSQVTQTHETEESERQRQEQQLLQLAIARDVDHHAAAVAVLSLTSSSREEEEATSAAPEDDVTNAIVEAGVVDNDQKSERKRESNDSSVSAETVENIESIGKSHRGGLCMLSDAPIFETAASRATALTAKSPAPTTGSPDSSGCDDPQSAVETKMLLNCLADKLSLK